MRAVMLVALGATLSGCMTIGPPPEVLAQQDDAVCRSYGAVPGTPPYIDCRMQRDNVRQQGADLKRAAVLASPN